MISRHKTFNDDAERGKSSTGWFYGFKLHLLVDDRKPVPSMLKNFIGQVFGDKGYISKQRAELLALENVELITTLKKNIFNLEHSRHRSLSNYMINFVAGLVAYSYQDKLHSLNIARMDLIPLF